MTSHLSTAELPKVTKRAKYGSRYFYAQSGAQDEMFHQADRKEHAFFVVHQNPGRGYASYQNVSDFFKVYTHIPASERHFYEIIRAGTPLRFYADVEFKLSERNDGQAQARLRALLNLISAVFKEINVTVTEDDWVIQEGGRKCTLQHNGRPGWKHSYHVNLKSVYFANNSLVLKTFMEAVRGRLPTAQSSDDDMFWTKWVKRGGSWREQREPIMDFGTNTRNRVWRLPLSSKYGDDTPLTLLTDADLVDAVVTVPPSDQDTVITEEDVAALVDDSAASPRPNHSREKTTSHRRPTTAPTLAAATTLQTAETSGLLRKLTHMLRRHGDLTSQITHEIVQGQSSSTRVFAGRTVGTRTCPWGHEHDSNNFYVTLNSTGEVRYHCHASTKSCSGKSVVYGHHYPTKDDFDLDTQGLYLVEEYEQQHVKPYSTAQTKVLLVKSGMNTGKTHMLRQTLMQRVDKTAAPLRPEWTWMRSTHLEDRYQRVLVIGTRIAFDKTMQSALQALGFRLYLDVEDVSKEDRLIIQYESLHKLLARASEGNDDDDDDDEDKNIQIQPFDCIVIDEVESLLNNTTSPMNKQHLQVNKAVFEGLIKVPGTKVLAMDADLSNKTVQCFKDLVGGNNITLHWNKRPSLERNLVLHDRFEDWLNLIKADLAEGKRLVIATGSRKMAEKHVEPLLQAADLKYRFYHAGCDDSILEDFAHLDEAWAQQDVVVFTSKVTVGADFALQGHFDRIYAYATAGSVPPRTLLQMCGRCRYPKDGNIRTFVQQTRHDATRLPLRTVQQRLTTHVTTMSNMQSQIFRLNPELDPETHRVELKVMPSWLNSVYTYNCLEQERACNNYKDELMRLATAKNYMVFTSPDQDEPEEHEEDAAEEVDDEDWDTKQARQFDETPDITVEEAEDIRRKKGTASATATEKLQLDKFNYTGYFERPVDGAHYVKINKHVSKLVNICMTTRATPAAVLLHDKRKWEHAYAEMVQASFTRLELITRLSRLLGLTGVLDTETAVTSVHLISIAPQLSRMWSLLAAEFKLRRTQSPTNLKQAVGLVNQVYGAWCGGHLKKIGARQRRRKTHRERSYTYKLGFQPVYNKETLLDIAEYSSFFVTNGD